VPPEALLGAFLSKYWIHNKPYHQYRCPACGEQYRPWQELPAYWRTNRVYVTHDLVGLRTGRDESDDVMFLPVMDTDAHHNQVMILPVLWLAETDIDRIKWILRDLEEEFFDLEPEHRLGFVLVHLSFTAPPRIFERFSFLPETKAAIDHLNSQPASFPWQYDHIERDGYMGIKIGPEHDMDEPMEQEGFIRTWFLSMWLTERAANCPAAWFELLAHSGPPPAAASSSEAAESR
jgi:hypothetical protein